MTVAVTSFRAFRTTWNRTPWTFRGMPMSSMRANFRNRPSPILSNFKSSVAVKSGNSLSGPSRSGVLAAIATVGLGLSIFHREPVACEGEIMRSHIVHSLIEDNFKAPKAPPRPREPLPPPPASYVPVRFLVLTPFSEPSDSTVNVYELSFGTVCGICAGVFVKKGAKALAFIFGGVFVLLQVSCELLSCRLC